MTARRNLTAKRVDAVLGAAMEAIEGRHDDDMMTDREYEEVLATIQLMYRRFVAGKLK